MYHSTAFLDISGRDPAQNTDLLINTNTTMPDVPTDVRDFNITGELSRIIYRIYGD